VCKAKYRRLHPFYDALCPECGDLNYGKRFQTADLRGRVALVTGARVKIGYQAALGACWGRRDGRPTTRFPTTPRGDTRPSRTSRVGRPPPDPRPRPASLAERRDLCSLLGRELKRLDLLVNNALPDGASAPGFYEHLLDFEELPEEALPAELRPVLAPHHESVRRLEAAAPVADAPAEGLGGLVAWRGGGAGLGLRPLAALAGALRLRRGRGGRTSSRAGRSTPTSSKVDLRAVNSWRLTLAEVATPEMIEVQLVNAVPRSSSVPG